MAVKHKRNLDNFVNYLDAEKKKKQRNVLNFFG